MKLLTLNTHSLAEENYKRKLSDFVEVIARERPHVMALQEVNQGQDAPEISTKKLTGYVACQSDVILRRGNHALAVAEGLSALGIRYHWTWLPVKRGYGIYDEGVAILSRFLLESTEVLPVSHTQDYGCWKTRKLLGARIGGIWFYSVHLGWWDDPDEPFAGQWARIHRHMTHRDPVFLMGDFNSPAETRHEGYDLIIRDGWADTYVLATSRDKGITVGGRIAGWTHRDLPSEGARVDHIFCNRPWRISSSRVIFNGDNGPVVSDHFGVMVETTDG